jgi:hypothetical protein
MNFSIDTLERTSEYAPATFYARLADTSRSWPSFTKKRFSKDPIPELKYKGEDIDLERCRTNVLYTSVPPNTKFIRHIQGPTSSSRALYPTLRVPDGQYLYPNMVRSEPVVNGKRLMYDTKWEDLNPIPGTQQIGYRRKLYPLTDQYARELSIFENKILPYPDY